MHHTQIKATPDTGCPTARQTDLDSMPPTEASISSESASGIRTSARHSRSINAGTRRKRDFASLGVKGTNGFTPEDRSAHLLNFWGAAEGGGERRMSTSVSSTQGRAGHKTPQAKLVPFGAWEC